MTDIIYGDMVKVSRECWDDLWNKLEDNKVKFRALDKQIKESQGETDFHKEEVRARGKDITSLQRQIKEADELLLKKVKETMRYERGDDDDINIGYISTTEMEICDYLAKKGYLIKVSDRIYKITEEK